MPDYDPKNIPVLDDVIESGDNDNKDPDLSAGNAELLDADSDSASFAEENNLDLFATEDNDLSAEDSDIKPPVINLEAATITDSIIEYTITPDTISQDAEPQIGEIDNISNENGSDITLYTPVNEPEDEAEKFESALIDYNAVDEDDASTIDMPVIDQPIENQPAEVNQQGATADSLQSITDDIVKQLMPELEQQLRLLLKQALKENSPEETSTAEASPSSNTDSY